MKKACMGAALLTVAGFTSAGASAINPSDDLHCAVAIRTLERNAGRVGASRTVRKGLYVLQTWYFSKLNRERLEEAQGVLETMRKAPPEVTSVGKKCSDRAFGDPGFPRWKSIASDDFESRVKQ